MQPSTHPVPRARVTTLLVAAMLATVLGGCSEAPPPTQAAPSFQTVLDIQQTMAWILDPAADVIWDSAGTIITAEGQQELAPTTDEGWATVLHAAATLTESGNLLMLPGRAMGDDWMEYSAGLVSAGSRAIAAAEARDPDALFDAGGDIYQVCKACHNQYWVKADSEQ